MSTWTAKRTPKRQILALKLKKIDLESQKVQNFDKLYPCQTKMTTNFDQKTDIFWQVKKNNTFDESEDDVVIVTILQLFLANSSSSMLLPLPLGSPLFPLFIAFHCWPFLSTFFRACMQRILAPIVLYHAGIPLWVHTQPLPWERDLYINTFR